MPLLRVWVHCPRASNGLLPRRSNLVGYVRWDARSDRFPPCQTIIPTAFRSQSHKPTSGTNSLIARKPTSVLPQFGNDFVGLQPAQTVCISRCRLRGCVYDRRRVPSARHSSGGRDCPDGSSIVVHDGSSERQNLQRNRCAFLGAFFTSTTKGRNAACVTKILALEMMVYGTSRLFSQAGNRGRSRPLSWPLAGRLDCPHRFLDRR